MIFLQRTTPNWNTAISLLPPRSLFKSVDQAHENKFVKTLNEETYTCVRHHYDTDQVFGGTSEENLIKAITFFETFIDQTFIEKYAPHTNFVEEWNEYLANSQNEDEVLARLIWAEAAAWVWQNYYRIQPELSHIRLVICNAAVGNWIDRRFAEIAVRYDCAIGYHPYDYWLRKERGEEGLVAALSMLWDTMELDWGLKVDWLFTEAGPFESAVTGWRSPECLGFDRTLYVDAVRQWLQDVKQTPAYAEGRIKGFALFTTGRTHDKWKGYWTEQPELDQLALMISQEWHPGQRPHDEELNEYLRQLSLHQQVISLNPNAALQRVIFSDNFVPVMGEYWTRFEDDEYAIQAAEHLETGERRVYYAKVPHWNDINFIS